MTEWSFEVPIPHLDDFDEFQDYYFMLSMLYKKSREYRNFHDQKPKELKWLDNSYNEQMRADRGDELLDLFYVSNACKVISPDSPEWNGKQLRDAFLFMNQVLKPEEIIVVTKHIQLRDYLAGFGAVNFAASYWTRPKEIINFNPILESHLLGDIHFLGLLSMWELSYFNPLTCDTSMPIKLAIQDKTMLDWLAEGCPHIHTKDLGPQGSSFFNTELSPKQLQLAKDNITWLKNQTR
jgi:hypothetical protein